MPDGLVRQCVDSLDSEFAILDADGTILYTNDAWQEFAITGGFPGDPAMTGENYFDAVRASRDDDEFAATACAGFEELLSGTETVFRFEYPCPGPADPDRWFLMWSSIISFEGKKYVVVEHIDITDRKHAERELRARNEILETLGSILSHDIRNPMSAALAWADVLRDADEPNPDHVERIVTSLERMDAMLDDALFLARGLTVESTESVDVGTIARLAWEVLSPASATLVVEESARVDASATLLQTLFENLFRNAIDHVGADVTVTVGVHDGGFFVADDGPGIPAEKREQVFEAGYTTNPTGNNTGMGLAIVDGVATAHDWDVTLTDTAGGGARFEINY